MIEQMQTFKKEQIAWKISRQDNKQTNIANILKSLQKCH